MIKKFKLTHGFTPLVKLKYTINDCNIFMKRDDLLDFYFGGNKVRLYEYIISEIQRQKAEKIITFGSIYSNHVRVTAAVAAYLKMECDIIILKERNNEEQNPDGNNLLTSLYNIVKHDCYTDEANEYIDKFLEIQAQRKVKFFFVPGGGHLPIAALGYMDCLSEIQKQCNDIRLDVDVIFTPTGTGTTQAGLLYGKKAFNFKGDIVGVTVARDVERCVHEITKLTDNMNKEFKTNYVSNENDVKVLEKYIGYGQIDDQIITLMKSLAMSDGILLDPIYNAKSFIVMEKEIKKRNYKNVIYINTGGTPNIFTEAVKRKVL